MRAKRPPKPPVVGAGLVIDSGYVSRFVVRHRVSVADNASVATFADLGEAVAAYPAAEITEDARRRDALAT